MIPFTLDELVHIHTNNIPIWKTIEPQRQQQGFLAIVENNHLFNFQLWQQEDEARREDLGAEYVYQAKRKIDQYNQQRNNCMEAMDEWLFIRLQPPSPNQCPVHSETPGMMIDRLSILALKQYHMRLQTTASTVSGSHRQQCQKKLEIIVEQQQQLQCCLIELLQEVVQRSRTFRIYHQFKMYNDPAYKINYDETAIEIEVKLPDGDRVGRADDSSSDGG